jgi:hypothetical protein
MTALGIAALIGLAAVAGGAVGLHRLLKKREPDQILGLAALACVTAGVIDLIVCAAIAIVQ